ncbi:hypothetical protein NDU88_003114 [Pleurodeles waltl]|uniref:Uncharacterized protein n=1 Tax=Pleurodeles waltl TaxID=8319 RepID=A0AAV7UXJ4_PLEWA|nr:hypothetical protein NDU88_003114 [Pleurodeles waltl]
MYHQHRASIFFRPRHWLVPFSFSGNDLQRRRGGRGPGRSLASGTAAASLQKCGWRSASHPRSHPADALLQAGVSLHLRLRLKILPQASVSSFLLRSRSLGWARLPCRERRPPSVPTLSRVSAVFRGPQVHPLRRHPRRLTEPGF